MKKINCILERELNDYFRTLYGFVFTAFLLLVGGIYTSIYCLQGGLASFERVVSSMTFLFLIVIPILTMRTFAEERRQKTEKLLYAAPVTMAQVVLGKFLALMGVIALPVLILALYPMGLQFFGDLDLPAAFCALIGFYLLGVTLAAIGMFVSAQVDNQAVAAGLSFLVTLLLFFLSSLADSVPRANWVFLPVLLAGSAFLGWLLWWLLRQKKAAICTGAGAAVLSSLLWMAKPQWFAGLLPKLMRTISPFDRFYVFLNGLFDWTAVVYFGSVTAVFLYLTVLTLEKRRWNG